MHRSTRRCILMVVVAGLAAKARAGGHGFFMGAAHHAIAPSMLPGLD